MPKKNENTEKIDIIIGKKIQQVRLFKGLSRKELSDQVGVTHQQLQKYEKGINRISAGRLASVAKALNVPVSEFFREVEEGDPIDLPDHHQRMCMEVARNFLRIKKPIYQDAINVLVRILADG